MDQLYLYVGLQERAGVEYIKLVRPTCGCVHGITNRKDETCARDSNLFYGHNVVGKRESIRFDASEMVASALLDSFFVRRKIFISSSSAQAYMYERVSFNRFVFCRSIS
jgi:hypothetical protein